MQYIDQVVVIHADRNNYIEFVIMKIFTYLISVLRNMSGSCFLIRYSDGKDVYGIWNVKDKDV